MKKIIKANWFMALMLFAAGYVLAHWLIYLITII